jgi:hypothetical protein
MTKLVSVRFEEKTIKQAEQTYNKKITGLRMAAEGYFEIRSRTLLEIEGYFEKYALELLIYIIKDTDIVPSLQGSKEVLMRYIDDYYEKSSPESIGEAGYNTLKTKIMSLTSAQIYFLQDAIHCLDDNDEKARYKFIITYSTPRL